MVPHSHPPPPCARGHENPWNNLLLARRSRIPSRPERKKRALALRMSGTPCRIPHPPLMQCCAAGVARPAEMFVYFARGNCPPAASAQQHWLSGGKGAARSRVRSKARLFRSGRTPSSGSCMDGNGEPRMPTAPSCPCIPWTHCAADEAARRRLNCRHRTTVAAIRVRARPLHACAPHRCWGLGGRGDGAAVAS